MKNYYEILEVNKRASKEVIDKAYKVLIKKYHPDLYKGEKHQYAERKAKEINEAYSILSNDFLKEQYDIELEKQEEQQKIRKQSQIKRNEEIQKQKENTEEKEPSETKRAKVGTLGAVVELTQNLIELIQKKGKKKGKRKNITAKDVIAVVLTIVIVVLVGVTLWFIPFTNGWMKELLFENPLFNWIGTLFS